MASPFRTTFLTTVLALVFLLGTFLPAAFAAPQFGRPLLHVYGAKGPVLFNPPSSTRTSSVAPSSTGVAESSPPANVTSASGPRASDSPSVSNSTGIPVASGTAAQSSGGSPRLTPGCGAIALGSAGVAAIYLVF